MDLRRLGLMVALLVGCAQAQFIGYTSPQSTVSMPFNNVTCTAALAAGSVLIQNIGQGAHFVTAIGGSATSLTYTIQGSYDGLTFFDISDVGTAPINSSDTTSLVGTGYYPAMAVKVSTCTPAAGTVTIKYSGISLTPGAPEGNTLGGQVDKHLALGVAANAAFGTLPLRAPFASSAGALQFTYALAAGPSGSTLTVFCNTSAFVTGPTVFGPFPLQTTLGLNQVFNIGNFPCPIFGVTYSSGGASTATFTLDYIFSPPGSAPIPFQYAHVTASTATVVKGTSPAFLHTLTINTSQAGTISIFDLPAASCTGTPATNTVAVITAIASSPPENLLYDTNFLSGICVKANVATMDFTVSFE